MSDTTGTGMALDLQDVELTANPGAAELYEYAVRAGEAVIAEHGPLVADTGRFTGRSPKDKFIVRDELTEKSVDWGEVNQPIGADSFELLRRDMLDYVRGKSLYRQDLFVGQDERFQRPVRVYTQFAWHSLFARTMFVREGAGADWSEGWTVLDLPGFEADPERHGVRSKTAILMNLSERQILVAGTEYAGEIKKGVFSAMNFELPGRDVMPMHCSANMGEEGDTALFFGLSGTGKTTLSADPRRELIGDDEHGWSREGIFNFEGGCYAKVIRLDPAAEPEIHAVTRRFGTILENVGFVEGTRLVDLDDGSKTENTRAAYPIDFIPNASSSGHGPHPRNIIFLTADAFGVLPPLSRLSLEQAMYHFLSGYTAKVAGTERGITEPVATFSACFGAPFMARHPVAYAELLRERLEQHSANVWLVNTGWTGGPYGAGTRIKLRYTRAMINAALHGQLSDVEFTPHPVFQVHVPASCPDVPSDVLDPRRTWPDAAAYDEQAARLASMFEQNFAQCRGRVAEEVVAAGPRT
jgi:phosphoenolpyruvate carboxykinase (ATP)